MCAISLPAVRCLKALEIKNLKKVYGNKTEALKGIDLVVETGDFFALSGGRENIPRTRTSADVDDRIDVAGPDCCHAAGDANRRESVAERVIKRLEARGQGLASLPLVFVPCGSIEHMSESQRTPTWNTFDLWRPICRPERALHGCVDNGTL